MTSAEMIDQIKAEMGWPAIDLEVSDSHIQKAINIAITMAKDYLQPRRYKSYAIGTAMNNLVKPFTYSVDLGELDYDVITEVYRGDFISPYVYDSPYYINYAVRGIPVSMAIAINSRSTYESLLNRQWKVIDNKLYLDKYYCGVTVEFIPKTIVIEDVDDSYWIGWIQRYALAVTKGMESKILGKFVIDSNPFKTNTDQLASESTSEKAELMEELNARGYVKITR